MSRIRSTVAVLAFLALPLATAGGQAEADRLAGAAKGEVLRAHLEFLADDALEGRAPATRGGELAAKYIAAQFRRLGLEPAGDEGGYFHRVPVIALTPDPTLRIRGGADSARALAYRTDYVLWSMRNEPRVALQGGVVFAGYGIVAPEQGWDDYRGVDVKGKVVVVLVNDPGLRDSSLFKGKTLTYYGRWTYKIEEAARQGAAGILLVHTPESATYGWSTVMNSWTGPQIRLEAAPTSLVAAGWLTESVAADLLRRGGQDLARLTQRAGRRGFRAVALSASVDGTVASEIRRSATMNVIARLPGEGPLADEAVMIGGHYDHLGVGTPVHGDSIFNGAEDNASGTAAVLAAAEAFVRSGVRPKRSVLFMAFAAEESGLLGSQAFAARPTLPLRRLAAVLNMDVMNLYGRTADIAALGTDQSSLGTVFAAAAAAEGLRVSVNQDALTRGAFFRSDHFPMVRAGVPALSLQSGETFEGRPAEWGKQQEEEYTRARYHQVADEILPWFTMDGAVQQLRVVLRTALAVANAPQQPTWSPGSEFQAAGAARLR